MKDEADTASRGKWNPAWSVHRASSFGTSVLSGRREIRVRNLSERSRWELKKVCTDNVKTLHQSAQKLKRDTKKAKKETSKVLKELDKAKTRVRELAATVQIRDKRAKEKSQQHVAAMSAKEIEVKREAALHRRTERHLQVALKKVDTSKSHLKRALSKCERNACHEIYLCSFPLHGFCYCIFVQFNVACQCCNIDMQH